QARADGRQRKAEFARGSEQISNGMIQCNGRAKRRVRLAVSDIDTASAAKLNPAVALKLAIPGAYGVWMQPKPTRQIPDAWQALSGSEVAAEDPQNDLRCKLLADGDVSSARKPELHDEVS